MDTKPKCWALKPACFLPTFPYHQSVFFDRVGHHWKSSPVQISKFDLFTGETPAELHLEQTTSQAVKLSADQKSGFLAFAIIWRLCEIKWNVRFLQPLEKALFIREWTFSLNFVAENSQFICSNGIVDNIVAIIKALLHKFDIFLPRYLPPFPALVCWKTLWKLILSAGAGVSALRSRTRLIMHHYPAFTVFVTDLRLPGLQTCCCRHNFKGRAKSIAYSAINFTGGRAAENCRKQGSLQKSEIFSLFWFSV